MSETYRRKHVKETKWIIVLLVALIAVGIAIRALVFESLGSSDDDAAASQARLLNCTEKNRLDIVTAGDSFAVQLGAGNVYRVPKCLLYGLDFSKTKEPIRLDRINMTFWYPDMTLTNAVPAIDKIMERKRGIRTYEKDRFRVNIFWMWHSPPNADKYIPCSDHPEQYGPRPRPPRILLNLYDQEVAGGGCRTLATRIRSRVPGTEEIIVTEWLRSHPEILNRGPGDSGIYVEAPSSQYELFMSCPGVGGLTCRADVYSKKHQLQYRMDIPAESYGHIRELMHSIDKMLDIWSKCAGNAQVETC